MLFLSSLLVAVVRGEEVFLTTAHLTTEYFGFQFPPPPSVSSSFLFEMEPLVLVMLISNLADKKNPTTQSVGGDGGEFARLFSTCSFYLYARCFYLGLFICLPFSPGAGRVSNWESVGELQWLRSALVHPKLCLGWGEGEGSAGVCVCSWRSKGRVA